MTTEEMIRAAQAALGAGTKDDYLIQPTKHADELAADAPALAAILRKTAVSVLADEYERKDTEAIENQLVFKTTASRANWAVLLTACFSTLLLIVGPLKSVFGPWHSGILAILGVCGVISGALGSMWIFQTREGKLLDNWMKARAAAEALRSQYFEEITNYTGGLPEGENSPIQPTLLQFEYFRRYQLDVQLAFFKKRAMDHRRDSQSMLQTVSLTVALASISAGLAVVLSSALGAGWVSIAALGTVATALAAFATTRESVNQSRQNMERYNSAYEALILWKRKLDDVRRAAATGEREPVKQFVDGAHEQITAEHRQWLAAAQNIQPAIDKLDDALAKSKEKPKPGEAKPAAAKAAERP